MEFGSDVEMQRVSNEAQEFFEKVLYDDEPLFVSDEATLWGVWMGDVGEVLERCSSYYGVPVSFAESQQPFRKRLRLLNEKRAAASRESDSLDSVPLRVKSTLPSASA